MELRLVFYVQETECCPTGSYGTFTPYSSFTNQPGIDICLCKIPR